MATIDYAFLCDYAFMDASGKTYIIGTFDNINANAFPLHWAQLFVAIRFKAIPGENLKVRALLTAPSGEEIYQVEAAAGIRALALGNQDNPPDPVPGFLPLPMYNISFSEVGEHRIEIFVNDTPVHSIPLTVQQHK